MSRIPDIRHLKASFILGDIHRRWDHSLLGIISRVHKYARKYAPNDTIAAGYLHAVGVRLDKVLVE